MRNILTMILLIGSCMHCHIIAQEIDSGDKKKIVDYVNSKYTSLYVLKNPQIFSEKEKNTIESIDTIFIENAIEYSKLDSVLIHGGLEKTAENLTNKLNVRNNETDDKDIFLFADRVVDTRGFENFKFSKEDECKLRNEILKWYFSKEQKDISPKKESEESNNQTQIQEEKKYPYWVWPLLVVNILYIIYKIIMNMKERNSEDEDNSQPYNSLLPQSTNGNASWKEIVELREKNKELRQKVYRLEKFKESEKNIEGTKQIVTDTPLQNIDNIESVKEDIYSPQESKSTLSTTSSIVSVVYYADVDVSNNFFVRSSEKVTKKSVYTIDANKQTFTLINDEQLYEAKLSKVNASGILDACEVKGNYKTGKTVAIIPGNVQQDENGKWRIINKAIIEIK